MQAGDPAVGHELDAAMAELLGSAGQGNADLVETAELAVRSAPPGEAFSFTADGEPLKVYGRKGLPCRRCRTPIVTERFGGRTTFYCPQCQS